MATTTTNLGLTLPDGSEYVSRSVLNGNFQKIDDEDGEILAGVAIVCNGDSAPRNITSGQFLYIKNHSSLPNGAYHATANISSGASITSSNTSPDPDGIGNALNDNIVPQDVNITKNTTDWSTNNTKAYRIGKLVIVNPYVIGIPINGKTICSGLPAPKVAFTLYGNPCGILVVDANGVLSVNSAGTASAVYFGQSIVYTTSE